ncbi:MAG: hypothetical protein R3224_03675 [Balneolaceae bacterium]|nr:hypothetical protein [Balneolaceae bacterium]
MKRVLIITILLALFSLPSAAQIADDQARSGSVYSNLGVGIPTDLASSSALGMGLTGVSFVESNVPGIANPAEWGSTVYTLATGGFSFQKFNSRDNTGTSANAVFAANTFQLQFPLIRDELGVSVSFAPLTQSNFRIIDTNTQIIGSGSQADTLIANVENRGTGGVNNLEFGMGWKINRNISIGYAASLQLASIENNVTALFENSSYQGVGFSRRLSGYGFGNRIGTLIRLPSLLSDSDQLQLGAAVRLPVDINSDREQSADKPVGPNAVETVVLESGSGLGKGDIRMPMEISGGLTYRPTRTLYVTGEGLYQQWSDFRFSYSRRQQNLMSDRYKGGIGIRYFPFISGTNTFLSRFKYRAGVSYDTGHLDINGERIESWTLSAGIGIPSPKSRSSIDLNFFYGRRGTETQNLVKESIWGLRLSINLAELMFIQPKLQ